MDNISINTSIQDFLETIRMARSENTFRTYQNGMNAFKATIQHQNLDIEIASVTQITEKLFAIHITSLKNYAPATERLYLTTLNGYYEYLVAENLVSLNLQTIKSLIRKRARKTSLRLPQFPKSAIETIIEYISTLSQAETENRVDRFINLRDRAFLLCLADTGLRVHEACKLRRGDIDWFEGKAIIIGKGNKEDVIRFSERSIRAIRDYLNVRSELDGASGVPLTSLPIFARHDKGAGKRVKSITTTTGRNIVSERVRQFLGEQAVGTITPHSFRHYFVTRVLDSSGNLKLAQSLARHRNIAITQRYAHINDDELDRGYNNVFK
jgi:site-specific recombinase XerD